MNNTNHDVIGIGNAIVDILAYTDEIFLSEHSLTKGAMTLIDEKEAHRLYKNMGAATECSGGSAANTLAGLAMLGGRAAFIGNVKDDQFGEIFRKSLDKAGVMFETPSAESGPPTAQCLIFVTEEEGQFGERPKVERTMATYLGASSEISSDYINENTIKSSKVLFFEGYLWDNPKAQEAVLKAIRIAHDSGHKVSFTLSDPFCVDRHREAFLDLVDNHIDILFANEHEIEALYQENDIRKILYRTSGKCEIAAVTRSEKGSYILVDDHIHTIEPELVEDVYDVTGAGDLYAAGFLYGYVHDFEPEKCGRLGSLCATEVIKYLGARPVSKLSNLLEKL